MKLTGDNDNALIEGKRTLKFQVKIPKTAYLTGVPNLAHFLAPGVGFKFQNAILNLPIEKTQRHFDYNT
jgi:hypothetical protein